MTGAVFGVQPVIEALKEPQEVAKVLLSRERGGATERIEKLCRAAGVPVKMVARDALERLAGGSNHQGVAAELRAQGAKDVDLDALLDRATEGERPLILLLDGIQDPHNLGAILRSAHALGVDGVVLPQDRSAPVGPAAIKVSAGAALRVPIARVVNLKHALEPLSARGLWTAAAVMDGTAAPQLDLDRPLALVLGGEQKGVRPSLARRCDLQLSIPMAGGFDSLNASVAAGILLYEVRRQQRRDWRVEALDTPRERP